jgi:hypothetical protein
VALVLSPACEPAQSPASASPTVSLRLRGEPANAIVLIDEETIGTLDFVADHGVALPPGHHRVTVRSDGCFAWDQEVEAKKGSGPLSLSVRLVPVPD